MCCLFVNFGTYTCYSIVFFVKYSHSIYFLCLANEKTRCSSYIPNACTFCTRSADFLPRVQYPNGMCSLFVNFGTYTCYSIVFFVKVEPIYLLLTSSKQEEHLYLMYCQLLYILYTIRWFLPKSLISTWYVFSFCEFLYYPCYSIVFFVK